MHSLDRLVPVIAIHPRGIGGEGRPNALEEHGVVRRRLRGAAKRHDTLDHVRMAHRPLKRLLGAHRPPGHQSDPSNAESRTHQPVLRRNIVSDRDGRKVHPIEW